MAEYIDREALLKNIDMFCDMYEVNWTIGRIRAWINKAPAADVVEVVRCKDCKFICPEVDVYTRETVGYVCRVFGTGNVDYEDFCSYGERKE